MQSEPQCPLPQRPTVPGVVYLLCRAGPCRPCREHWFTVRSIYGQWWNLNSVFSAPEPVSDFYLSAFLGSLQHQGYDIFVVSRGPPARLHGWEVDRRR